MLDAHDAKLEKLRRYVTSLGDRLAEMEETTRSRQPDPDGQIAPWMRARWETFHADVMEMPLHGRILWMCLASLVVAMITWSW